MKNILILLLSITSILFSGILIPENGRLIKTVHVLFEWEQEVDAVAYNLQISTDESFNDIISDINLYKTIHIEKNILDWNDDYYWRVRSIYIDNSF